MAGAAGMAGGEGGGGSDSSKGTVILTVVVRAGASVTVAEVAT